MLTHFRRLRPWPRTSILRGAATLVLFLWGVATWAAAQDSLSKSIEALASPDEKVRVQAIDALGRMGPGAKEAVKALTAQLNDKAPSVRAHAAFALQSIGPAAAEATESLIKAVSDPDAHVRRMAINALSHVQADPKLAMAALGQALHDPDPAVRVTALNALTSAGEAAVPTLTAALDDQETRYWATLALGELGSQAKPAVQGLIGALKDDRPEVRREVLMALGHIGPDASTAASAVAPYLASSDPAVCHAAAFALGRMGSGAADAAGALGKALESKDQLLRTVSAWALARIDPKNEASRDKAIALFTATLKDENPRVQVAALKGLVELENDPAKLVPILADAICQGDPPLVDEALAVVSSLGEAATPALIEALKRPEACARATALIGRLGSKASTAVPALVASLGDQDPEVRREVLLSLASMGADAAPAKTAVTKALGDPEVRVRTVAAYALGSMGTVAASAAPELRRELESTDPVLRVASAWALVHVSQRSDLVAPEVLPVLLQGLKNQSVAVRRGSAEALGRLGKAARSAEGALRVAARDPDESVRNAGLAALERIGIVIDSKPQFSVPLQPKR